MASAFGDVQTEDRARLERLLRKGWRSPGDHPLRRLHGMALGEARVLVLLGPRNAVGSRYFHLFLVDRTGRLGEPPVALGLFNGGPYPAYNWLELTRYEPVLRIGDEAIDLRRGPDVTLFESMSPLVPGGGHFMVEYDSPGQQATARMLGRGYPAACSPLGYLLFLAGCRAYRDWYIPEGGREGPRKLQAFKPLNDEGAQERSEKLRRQLSEFLARGDDADADELARLARENASHVLDALPQQV